jgi:hypothetical protein
VNIYYQCGGIGWSGLTNCCVGLSCIYMNDYYYQCLSTPNASATLISSSSPATVSYDNISRQNASTGTYWDCCKVSCGWPDKASVTSPPQTCQQDGVTAIDSNIQSFCNGGSTFMCIDQQPWNISSNLSYGYAGAGLIVSDFYQQQNMYLYHIRVKMNLAGVVLVTL